MGGDESLIWDVFLTDSGETVIPPLNVGLHAGNRDHGKAKTGGSVIWVDDQAFSIEKTPELGYVHSDAPPPGAAVRTRAGDHSEGKGRSVRVIDTDLSKSSIVVIDAVGDLLSSRPWKFKRLTVMLRLGPRSTGIGRSSSISEYRRRVSLRATSRLNDTGRFIRKL